MSKRERMKAQERQNAPVLTSDGREVVARASGRFLHGAPRKLAFVAREIRNKPVQEALDMLRVVHRPSAVPHIEKVLRSAVANATDLVADPMELVVGEIRVEGAPMMKRIRPATMGRAFRVRKRLSHLHILLTQE